MAKLDTTLSVKIIKDMEKGSIGLVNPSTDGAEIPAILFCKLLEAMHKVDVEWNEQLRKGQLMYKRDSIFGKIAYWFRSGQLGLSGKKRKYQDTLWWKRIGNADRRKAIKELDKALSV